MNHLSLSGHHYYIPFKLASGIMLITKGIKVDIEAEEEGRSTDGLCEESCSYEKPEY